MNWRNYVLELLKNYTNMRAEITRLNLVRNRLEGMCGEELLRLLEEFSLGAERFEWEESAAREREKLRREADERLTARLRLLRGAVGRLEYCITRLEPHQAAILQDCYFEHYSWRELERLRDVSPKVLMKYRREGIEQLAQMYCNLGKMGMVEPGAEDETG